MPETPQTLLRRWFEAERARPLGDASLASGRTLQPFSRALQEGAGNLLDKAAAARHQGDLERSTAYVCRAAALPYDEHEDIHPAVFSAHIALFSEVTGALEESEAGDRAWLTTALEVLDQADGVGAVALRNVLAVVAQDFTLESPEVRLIRRTVGKPGPEPDFGLTRASSAEDVRLVVLSLLRVTHAYHEALHH